MPKVVEKQTSPLLADEKVLPLKELFLDGARCGSEKLEIYWQSSNRIVIKSDGHPIFGPLSIRDHVNTLNVI
jgi:hypothetical protein